MYERMKVVFSTADSFTLEVSAPTKDEFYYQLLSNFKDALNDYNYGLLNINYIECANLEKDKDFMEIAIRAYEPISQGLDMVYAVFRFMSARMTQAQYRDFVA